MTRSQISIVFFKLLYSQLWSTHPHSAQSICIRNKQIIYYTPETIGRVFDIHYGEKDHNKLKQRLYKERDEIIETIERNFGINYDERPQIGRRAITSQKISFKLIPRGNREDKYWNDFLELGAKTIYENVDALYDGINHKVRSGKRIPKNVYRALSHELVHGLVHNKNPSLDVKETIGKMIGSTQKVENKNMKLLSSINGLPARTLDEGLAEYVSIHICSDLRGKFALELEYENALRSLDRVIEIRDKLQIGEKLHVTDGKIYQLLGKSDQYTLGYKLVTKTVGKLGYKCIETLIKNPPETLEEIRNPDIYAARISYILNKHD